MISNNLEAEFNALVFEADAAKKSGTFNKKIFLKRLTQLRDAGCEQAARFLAKPEEPHSSMANPIYESPYKQKDIAGPPPIRGNGVDELGMWKPGKK